jgi:hypothetical protein
MKVFFFSAAALPSAMSFFPAALCVKCEKAVCPSRQVFTPLNRH